MPNETGLESNLSADGAGAFDRERHQLRNRLADPVTLRHLREIGVPPGGRCLVVAAGSGSIAKWLAEQVGIAGKVVATELDTRFLLEMGMPEIEVRRHDVSQESFEPGSYDLVHCRALLMHLPDPASALRRMVEALKPGGWLLVEEADFSSVAAVDPGHRDAERFDRLSRALAEIWRKARVMDPRFGRRVRGLVEALGLDAVRHEGATWVHRGGEDGAKFMHMTTQLMPHLLLAWGILADDLQFLGNLFADPSFSFVDVTLFCAWGRKPVDASI